MLNVEELFELEENIKEELMALSDSILEKLEPILKNKEYLTWHEIDKDDYLELMFEEELDEESCDVDMIDKLDSQEDNNKEVFYELPNLSSIYCFDSLEGIIYKASNNKYYLKSIRKMILDEFFGFPKDVSKFVMDEFMTDLSVLNV